MSPSKANLPPADIGSVEQAAPDIVRFDPRECVMVGLATSVVGRSEHKRASDVPVEEFVEAAKTFSQWHSEDPPVGPHDIKAALEKEL